MDIFSPFKGSKATFSFVDSPYVASAYQFEIDEKISGYSECKVWLASEDVILPDAVMEQAGLLTIKALGSDRYFHGVFNDFMHTGRNGRFHLYQGTLVSNLWFLSLCRDCRIFQDKTVVEIVEDVLKEYDLTSDDFEFRLASEYKPIKHCTQLNEDDLHFVSRLLETEGIFYFFEHSSEGHLLVFADDPVAYLPVPGECALQILPDDGMIHEKEVLNNLVSRRGIRAGSVTHRNYNFKRSSLDMTAQQQTETHPDYEVYEYRNEYGLPEDGQRVAKIRLEELKSLETRSHGISNCPRLIPGFTFTVMNHDIPQMNDTYLVIGIKHEGLQSYALGEKTGIGGDFKYTNTFVATKATVPVRPERLLNKPVVQGLMTAVVVGPPDEEIHVDEFGRIRVWFPWDRRGQQEKSSCWLRVLQPWGGNGRWGAHFLPRVGDEVLVDFHHGDIDRPVVVGSAYNSDSPPLYNMRGNKTYTGIRTTSYPKGGPDNFHELRFEDKKGSEEIYLQSEKDWNILVKNDKGQTVGHDETLHVKHNRTKAVDVNQLVNIGANHTETIGANKSVTVKSNKTETVYINSAETVGAAKELTIGGLYQVSVGGVMNETVGGAKAEEVGITKAVLVGSHMSEKVIGNRTLSVGQNLTATITQSTTVKAKTILLEAADEIVFKTGNSMISMRSNGDIVIQGATIQEKASGEIVVKGAKVSLN